MTWSTSQGGHITLASLSLHFKSQKLIFIGLKNDRFSKCCLGLATQKALRRIREKLVLGIDIGPGPFKKEGRVGPGPVRFGCFPAEKRESVAITFVPGASMRCQCPASSNGSRGHVPSLGLTVALRAECVAWYGPHNFSVPAHPGQLHRSRCSTGDAGKRNRRRPSLEFSSFSRKWICSEQAN